MYTQLKLPNELVTAIINESFYKNEDLQKDLMIKTALFNNLSLEYISENFKEYFKNFHYSVMNFIDEFLKKAFEMKLGSDK